MAYSLEELDEAISESVGPAHWAGLTGPGFSRVTALDAAARARFWKQVPEDASSAILREAYGDLCHDGCLRPVGGWEPDDAHDGGSKEPWE